MRACGRRSRRPFQADVHRLSKATSGATMTSSWRAVRPVALRGHGFRDAEAICAEVRAGMKRRKTERAACDHGQEHLPAPPPGLHRQRCAVEFAVGGQIERQPARTRQAGEGPEAMHGPISGGAGRGRQQGAAPGTDLAPKEELAAAGGWVCGHAADRGSKRSLPPVPVQPAALRPRASGGTRSGRAGFPPGFCGPAGRAQTADSTQSRKRD